MGIVNPVIPAVKITRGTFTGNGNVTHDIAHGLGVVPKLVMIWMTNSANAMFWLISETDSDLIMNMMAAQTGAVTAMTSANFTVGNTAVHNYGNTDTVNFQWIAFA